MKTNSKNMGGGGGIPNPHHTERERRYGFKSYFLFNTSFNCKGGYGLVGDLSA